MNSEQRDPRPRTFRQKDRRAGYRLLALLPILFAILPCSAKANELPNHADAPLRGIQFVDENEGWAVGDDGLILHTIDAGKTWEHQHAGTRASLRAVHFLTPYSGWVVGRVELPGGGSSGVVLSTSDGGLKWKVVNVNSVPGLNVVKFFDERTGMAAGDGGDSHPTGLFHTIDGGKTWRPVAGPRTPSWLAGDFSDAETGVVAGAWNRVAPFRDGSLGVADVDSLGGRNIRGLKLNGERAVAVGQGGLVMVSQNTAGVRWGFPDLKLPQELRASLDFNAVAVHGSHVWAVGRPGSVVFHSADNGLTWEMHKTGQPMPLNAIHFHDANTGWATGELGTIIVTTDGGKSWVVRRQGGMRAAVMFVHAKAEKTPWETISVLGGEEGYFATSFGLTCADPATLTKRYDTDAERLAAAMKAADPARASDADRLNFGLRQCGGLGGEIGWQFPLAGFQENATASAILDAWDKRLGEKATTAMLRQMVLAFRIWKPEVIVTDAAGDDELEKIVNAVVRKAFDVAADETVFPEQIKELGLEKWAGKKLFVTSAKADAIGAKVDIASPLPRIGGTGRDHAMSAVRLWGESNLQADSQSYRLVASRLKDGEGMGRIFEGVTLAPGGVARRPQPILTEQEEAYRASLQKAHEKKRNVELMVRGATGPLATPEQGLSQLADAVKDLPASDAGKALFTAGTSYVNAGRWPMAREAFLMLIDKYPGHPLSLDAARWMVKYQSSTEARRREELNQFIESTDIDFKLKDKPPQLNDFLPPGAKKPMPVTPPRETEMIQATHRDTIDGMVNARGWYAGALELEARLAAHGDIYARDVPLNLCWSSARRQLGKAEESQRWLMRYVTETTPPVTSGGTVRGSDPWRDCVLLESWLMNKARSPQPPKSVSVCKMTPKRPYLDGKLDDDCWANALPMLMATTAGELGEEFGDRESMAKGRTQAETDNTTLNTTRAAFSYDNEFMYVAVVCKHPAGMKKPKVETRTRDMDLSKHDRVSILIDLDRDYQTYYQLQIDQRGAVADDCWGDKTWNPRWFVAVNAEETGWTAEIAIPLSELSGDPITPGKLWAVNVVRTIPGKGIQAWSGPAGATPRPEGLGVMSFVK
ncbi:YCF48-related protein [Zavarzinella formosa]|uniref:YCF48-related protein n=1 Tax=Zavarzinella formosa TaxID=360055 RepID=UPI00031F766C|nr:YCF48-related protein [Zavarzinella formosa]